MEDQPGIVDQAVVVEGDVDAVGVVAAYVLSGGASCFTLVLRRAFSTGCF